MVWDYPYKIEYIYSSVPLLLTGFPNENEAQESKAALVGLCFHVEHQGVDN